MKSRVNFHYLPVSDNRADSAMKLLTGVFGLILVGVGFHFFQICSNRFMLLRRSKSMTPYLYGKGGILSLTLIPVALLGALVIPLAPIHQRRREIAFARPRVRRRRP